MANQLLFKGGQLAFKAGQLVFTTSAADCSCCGGCPDCSTCSSTSRTITVSGLTGNCDCINGVYTLPNIGGCSWEYSGIVPDGDAFSFATVDFGCSGGNWSVSISAISVCSGGSPSYGGYFAGTSAGLANRPGDTCGRLDTYTITNTDPRGCIGQVATVVVS